MVFYSHKQQLILVIYYGIFYLTGGIIARDIDMKLSRFSQSNVTKMQENKVTKLLDGAVDVIATFERGLCFLIPELTKLQSREIPPRFICWGCLLVEFKPFTLPEDYRTMNEKELLRAMTPDLPDGINVVDNLSDTLYIVNSRDKIGDPVPIFQGNRSVVSSATEGKQPPYGVEWCHDDIDNMLIVNMADKLYAQDNVVKVYLVLQTVPMRVAYVPRKD